MKTVTIVAKSVAKAIEQGLEQLGKNQEDVDIKILDEGGLFRKAKVEIFFDDGEEEVAQTEQQKEPLKKVDVQEKQEKKEKKDKQSKKQEDCCKQENCKTQTLEEFCTNYLQMLFQKMNIEAEVSFSKSENGTTFNASGKNVSALIGHHGETLNAVQEILSNAVKKTGFKGEKIFFDVENYKNRREISLISLAEKMADKAIKTAKPVRLERLNAYERRIVHTALAENEGVMTKSEGEEPNRTLVVIPKTNQD